MMRSHIPLTFPATRKALWCHKSTAEPVVLTCNTLSLSVTEQALYLAYGLSRTAKSSHCWLVGEINIEPDCSETIIYIDQLESAEHDSIFPGSFRVSTKLIRNSRHSGSSQLETAAVDDAIMHLANRAQQANKVQVSEFLHATSECTIFAGSNQISCDLNMDLMLPSCKFDLTPIEAVSIAATALSKSILGTDKHGIVSSQHKSGYMTMDQYRKVIFLLESDPKVLTVPIIGIWVSGVDFITHPYIWACCVRYMHTTQVNDRVAKPLEPFLLIHKSPLMSSAQYFDCKPESSNLNFNLLSGSNRFSMDKEVSGKRSGRMSVKLELQDLSSPRGLQFGTMVEQSMPKLDIENRFTPKAKRKGKKTADDSLPWSSPIPNNFQGDAVAHVVPDLSLLDESSPLEAPKPERLALQRVMDSRLNCSPNKKSEVTKQEDSIARKITSGSAENTSHDKVMFDGPVHQLSPSLRVPRPVNRQPEVAKQMLTSHRTPPRALHVSTQQQPISTHPQPLSNHPQPLSTDQQPIPTHQHPLPTHQQSLPTHQQSLPTHQQPLFTHQQPTLKVATQRQPLDEQPVPAHSSHPYVATQTLLSAAPCQCCHHRAPKCLHCDSSDSYRQPLADWHASQGYREVEYEYNTHNCNTTPANPLKVITANVRRLLSPQQGHPNTSRSNTAGRRGEEMDVSSIAVSGHSGSPCPCTPSPTSTQSVPISPEVEEILRQQDAQLKALQQQIQKLLKAQEVQPMALPMQKFATTQTTSVAAVNTGASLFEGYDSSTSDTQHSGHDSSRSHSLIQHDLTALDLPTQVTARSFTSDINVDYDSYEDSFNGLAKRDDSSHSRSEDSWLSPVLGESVSMMGESVDPESTKQQLDDIIKNVRDLLAKSTPAEGGGRAADEQLAIGESTAADPCDVTDTSAISINLDTNENLNTARANTAEKTNKVATSTRNQLQKMGINVEPLSHIPSEPLPALPRLQYLSMVMADTTLDCNRSLELNALALKYLHDEQLTELAHLTVHTGSSAALPREGSLLRQVLMLPTADSVHKTTLQSSDMSMATQQYLRRYELDTSSSEAGSDTNMPCQQLLDLTPASNLKSILRKGPEISKKQQEQRDKGQDMSLQVLDIARLRELPKLL